MKVELTIAGAGSAVLAVGHALVGRWVLSRLRAPRMPSTPVGPPSMTLGMVRFTWHIVTVFLVAFAILLVSLAWATESDPETLLLRLFVVIAVMCWVAAT